ncbi:MAG: HisA/HisF-related TIM barrel protein [Gemmataceae bacterium]
MIVVGVMDWQGGRLVQARGGNRSAYAPLGVDPLDLAQHWRERFGLHTLYFADLDAIAGHEPHWAIYERLCKAGVELWVDAGVRTWADRERHRGPWRVIVGLETLRDWQALLPGDLFSLDLRHGHPLGDWGDEPFALVQRAVDAGVHEIILLDLARVGSGSGSGTESLGAALRARFPQLHLFAAGGIRTRAEALHLQTLGFHGVLVASALHAGTWETMRS